jgi:cell wall-associated NlpC family hydrolase
MRSLVIISVVVWANVAFAQNNKKLDKLYQTKKFEKLLQKTKKDENKGKIDKATASAYQLVAHLGLKPSFSDTLIASELLDNAILIKEGKKKNQVQKMALQQYKAFLLRNITTFQKEKDTTNLKKVTEYLVVAFNDSAMYKKYFMPKVVDETKEKIANNITKQPNRDSVIAYANQLLGLPYQWAGMNPKSGFDCSGFTCYVYKKAGKELVHFAKEQAKEGVEISIQQAKKGDLIFFGKQYENGRTKIEHVGIFHSIAENGNPLIVHSSSKGVTYQEIKPSDYWSKKLLFCRNIIDNPLLSAK